MELLRCFGGALDTMRGDDVRENHRLPCSLLVRDGLPRASCVPCTFFGLVTVASAGVGLLFTPRAAALQRAV